MNGHTDDATVARFLSKVRFAPDGCWQWSGAKKSDGYGNFSVAGKTTAAHRFAYEQWVAPIPAGLEVDHLCRNRACVNPAHLEVVTHRTNLQRGVHPRTLLTHCGNGHEWNAANTRIRKDNGQRQCRACMRDQQRRYRAQARERAA